MITRQSDYADCLSIHFSQDQLPSTSRSVDALEKLPKLEPSADSSDVSCDMFVYTIIHNVNGQDAEYFAQVGGFSISSCVRKLALLSLMVHQREIPVSLAQQRY